MVRTAAVAIALAMAVTPAAAQNIDAVTTYEELLEMDVPVIAGDITDRPYRVVEHITKGVRKATIFSRDPSQEKVYRELWERGRKVGADAVLNATYGPAERRALSAGSREARGDAVVFLTDEEIAELDRQGRL